MGTHREDKTGRDLTHSRASSLTHSTFQMYLSEAVKIEPHYATALSIHTNTPTLQIGTRLNLPLWT